VSCVPVELRGEVVNAETEVTELDLSKSNTCLREKIAYFVYFSRTGFEALEGLLAWLLGFEVYFEDLLFWSLVCYWCLTVDEIDGKAFWVFYC
jgi:hypothetical protein